MGKKFPPIFKVQKKKSSLCLSNWSMNLVSDSRGDPISFSALTTKKSALNLHPSFWNYAGLCGMHFSALTSPWSHFTMLYSFKIPHIFKLLWKPREVSQSLSLSCTNGITPPLRVGEYLAFCFSAF